MTRSHTLTLEWILDRIERGTCEMTGMEFDLTERPNRKKVGENPFAPSLDRIDADKGYDPDNVRVVVQIYNLATGRYSQEAFERFVLHMAERIKNGLGEGQETRA